MKITLSILAILLAFSLSAKELWVSPLGNDNNPGTESRPFKSIQSAQFKARQLRAANAPIKDEIKIILKEGTYMLATPLVFGVEDSGSPESPTVITAAKDAKVV